MSGRDDLGHILPAHGPAGRVVSLVPSLTEAIATVRATALVGVTDWCTHPAGLPARRVRGTKNPDLAAIAELAPDLVVASQEENRQVDVERLREAGIPVWVTAIESLDGAFTSLRRLFADALGWPVPGWIDAAEREWAPPATGIPRRCVVPIWRDPWLVVGAPTFAGDVLARLGLTNVYASDTGPSEAPSRYPHTTVEEMLARRPDLVVLPDEPYPFGVGDGPEAFPELPCALIDGRLLTWYGPSLVGARERLTAQLR